MRNFIQNGDVLTFIAAADTASGTGVQVGKLFGISATTVKAGQEGEMSLTGVFELPKLAAQAWTMGAVVYWDDTAKVVTTTASTNVEIGHAVLAAANPSGTGRVRLSI